MQTRIDWTTGGLSFYDVDPPKRERGEDFTPDYNINSQFDPIPSQYSRVEAGYRSKNGSSSSSRSEARSSARSSSGSASSRRSLSGATTASSPRAACTSPRDCSGPSTSTRWSTPEPSSSSGSQTTSPCSMGSSTETCKKLELLESTSLKCGRQQE